MVDDWEIVKGYKLCSHNSGDGIEEVFQEAVRIALITFFAREGPWYLQLANWVFFCLGCEPDFDRGHLGAPTNSRNADTSDNAHERSLREVHNK